MFGDMYGDFSRLTFAPENHFSAVLLQQGRVMLDADANELTAILLRMQRLLIADLIGPYAGPVDNTGFAITYESENTRRLRIGSGRYYVQGLVCELDEETTYDEQPSVLNRDVLPAAPFFVYLRVWERQITVIQDPLLRDVALGAPDTAVRSKVVWDVVAAAEFPPGSNDLVSDWSAIDADSARTKWRLWEQARVARPRPLLKACARRSIPEDLDRAGASPNGGYRGLENQLYRVEVHDGGSSHEGAATFKWSRDNGAATFPIESRSRCELTLASLRSDGRLELAPGDWVEVLDDHSVLSGERHPLLRVGRIEPVKQLVTLEGQPPEHVASRPDLHPFLRPWNQREIPLTETTTGEDGWLDLEQGVQIQFQSSGEYTAGDYWLIPARVANRDIEWPTNAGEPAALPPTGVVYGYAPLAIVDGSGTSHDLRSAFAPIAKLNVSSAE